MFILVFLAYFFLFSIVFQHNYIKKCHVSLGLQILFIASLYLVIVFRSSSLPDYQGYYNFFNYKGEERFEYTAKIIRIVSPSFFVFLFIYAAIGISTKLYAISKNSNFPILGVVAYLSTSFILHDLIQIRVSCAIGFFLISIKYLYDKKYIKYFLLVFVAVSFHKSALILLLFPIFVKDKFNKLFWIPLVLVSYLFIFFHFDVVSLLFTILDTRDSYYIHFLSNITKQANPLNINQILRTLIFIMLALTYQSQKKNVLSPILLKIFAISIIIVPLFYKIPVVAYRVSEFLGTVSFLLFPNIVLIFKKRSFGYMVFLILCAMFFYLNVIHNNFIGWK